MTTLPIFPSPPTPEGFHDTSYVRAASDADLIGLVADLGPAEPATPHGRAVLDAATTEVLRRLDALAAAAVAGPDPIERARIEEADDLADREAAVGAEADPERWDGLE